MTGFSADIAPERTLHIRLDKLLNSQGQPIPQDTPYAMLIECEQNVTFQYTRVDTSQPEMAIATTRI